MQVFNECPMHTIFSRRTVLPTAHHRACAAQQTSFSPWSRIARLLAWPDPSRGCADTPRTRPDVEPTLLYPPPDPGLPAANSASLIAAQAPFMARLRAAVGDDAGFARSHLPAIEALARYVHLLPASAHAHFSGAGGLFRLSLECALSCMEAAAGRIAALSGALQQGQALASRWRHAAFLAGLVCELRVALSGVVVCDAQGREWAIFEGGLDAWIDQVGAQRYHVNWLPDAGRGIARAHAVALLAHVFPAAAIGWLDEGSPTIARELYAVSLGDPEARGSPLADLVEAVRREVLRKDAAQRSPPPGQARVGLHLEWHLLDALRSRFECGDWSPGPVGEGMCWWQSGTLCVRWPDAGHAIVSDLRERGLQGVPRASLTLVECLAAARLLVPDARGRWVWSAGEVEASAAARGSMPAHQPAALRFADAAALWPAFHAHAGGVPACCETSC